MKLRFTTLVVMAGLSFGGLAAAQDAPVGGPTAKGNAPLKSTHPVNNGAAKPGANSFTQNEARKHILHSGFTTVSGLTKGSDGVWRGTAMRGRDPYNVALDFKGNVTDGGPVGEAKSSGVHTTSAATLSSPSPATSQGAALDGADKTAVTPTAPAHQRGAQRRPQQGRDKPCMVQGAACSGTDKNDDGIADKDEHRTQH